MRNRGGSVMGRPAVRGVGGRSVVFLLVLAVAMVYATATGRWSFLLTLILRVS